MHSKAGPRCLHVVAWATFGVVSGWYAVSNRSGIALLLYLSLAVLLVVGASLPLVCGTARLFVHTMRWWFPLLCLDTVVLLLFLGAASGTFSSLFSVLPLALVSPFLIRFRPRWFFVALFLLGTFPFGLQVPLACIAYGTPESGQARTFGECVERRYQKSAGFMYMVGCALLLLICRKIANVALTWCAARASRELHRHAFPSPPHAPPLSLSRARASKSVQRA